MSEDQELVTAVLARAPGAFERFVVRHQGLVWHVVFRMVKHAEDARELSQEVFLRIHQRLHQYRFESSLATWVGRVAFSVASRHLQRKRLPLVEAEPDAAGDVLDAVSDGFDLEAAWADHEARRLLDAAIDGLPPLQRTLVTLYHLDELPVAQIAAVTGVPEGTVKNYLFRARQQLRRKLESSLGAMP